MIIHMPRQSPVIPLVLAISALCLACQYRLAPSAAGSERGPDPLAEWLRGNGVEPRAYVTGLFENHDVVFLGEYHRIRHDLVLVQSLVAPMYEGGVHFLATEFGRREDQALIDRLVLGETWDEELARKIVFRNIVFWGYQEYVDVYRSVWELNRSLAADAPRMRVVGLNDSPDWSWVRTEEDRDRGDVMRKVWRGGGEQLWAETILDLVQAGHKILVHCGIHHAFTRYRQPLVSGDGEFIRFGDYRAGNVVYESIGDRAVTVFLHAPWSGEGGYSDRPRLPADGTIDAAMDGLDEGPRPLGFDIVGSPFGEVRVVDTVYRHGYPDFKLSDFCDGWIYTCPVDQYQGVTPIEGWIHDGNLAAARKQCPNPRFRDAGAEEFNRALSRDADISRRFKHLHR